MRNRTPQKVEFEEYTYDCPSDTYGEPPYRVDLEAHAGRGECACEDWDIVRRFAMKQGEKDPDKIQCKHVKRCLIEWAIEQDPMIQTSKTRREILIWAREEIKKRYIASHD